MARNLKLYVHWIYEVRKVASKSLKNWTNNSIIQCFNMNTMRNFFNEGYPPKDAFIEQIFREFVFGNIKFEIDND